MLTYKEYVEKERASRSPVVLWYLTNDAEAHNAAQGLIEEGRTYKLDNRYSARFDIAHQPNQKNHTHVYLKGNEVCVVNDNGTPSHKSPPFSTLPSNIQSKIRSLKLVEASSYLSETASGAPSVLITRSALAMLWLRLLAPE
ncbi:MULTISPECIES: hypothetical protein [unclassified Rhizobium]|uniref:hypothetical protein n=1 Tax=unclassified Rhizobium TaxID=2613769 RepID=UPI001ADBE291|nr:MULTISPECIES: hypothetical protein [unclassified Rhizobium]MBO9100330.1 hypothetical protein [Rhizobium sp. L58/93]MBO9186223.1 hypothetical protein [Rhizobium sp. E27B/91]QXZ83142.1 hypothetical protein J5287_13815 [Rhizobium sp. K1/93]QXZ89346.1 hypothetical protein J5280_14775 [Rhizobium sp. K15/93]QYA01934.1 hypothetical protein J5278_01715 [Rhizobium sp. B21/90]